MDNNQEQPKDVLQTLTTPEQKQADILGRAARYDENPFMADMFSIPRGKKRITIKGGKSIIDDQTGEYETTAEVVQVREVDKEQFVKIYTARAKAIFGLTGKAQEIFQILIQQVQDFAQEKDTVFMSEAIVTKYFVDRDGENAKIPSRTTVRRALSQLIQAGIIARTVMSKDLYYINPRVIFNGDRMRFIDEYRISKGLSKTPTSQEMISSHQQRANLMANEDPNQLDAIDYINEQERIDRGGM